MTTNAVRAGIGEVEAGTKLAGAVNRVICGLGTRSCSSAWRESTAASSRGSWRHWGTWNGIRGRLCGSTVATRWVSLDVGEEDDEETRIVDADYLEGMGIDTDGQPIIVIDQHWSPDTSKTTYYQPAVVVSDEDPADVERWEQLLRSRETPPPRDRGGAEDAEVG